ncbi:hypothetical protein [Actinocorallia libanotica]|uniref:Uncharacterized protein n=1 Tax=Actinocorallia libanotica TaxID=46162 RepID=A0ABP4B9U7_9ACTN
MRRPVLTFATAFLVSACLAGAVPAEAGGNGKARPFRAENRFKAVSVSGKYVRGGKSVVVTAGKLIDKKKDGYAAGVFFKFTRKGRKADVQAGFIRPKSRPGLADGPASLNLAGITSRNTGHMYVRECRMAVKATKPSCGPWTRIY